MSVKIKLVEFTMFLGWALFWTLNEPRPALACGAVEAKQLFLKKRSEQLQFMLASQRWKGVEIFSDDGACWWASTQITASGTGNRQLGACTEMKRASKRGGRFLGSRLEAWLLILLPGQVSFELKGSVNKVHIPAQNKEDSAWLLAWSGWVIQWTP